MNDPNIVILAGGLSSRMKRGDAALDHRRTEEIANNAKCMLAVGRKNIPFLSLLLQNVSDAGFSDVVLLTGQHDRSIREHYETLGHQKEFPRLRLRIAVQIIPDGRTKPYGTADALMQALESVPEWKGKSCVVCNSDNLYSAGALRTIMLSPGRNATLSYDSAALRYRDERVAQFAVLQCDANNRLSRIIEKPTPDELRSCRDAEGRIGVSMNAWKFSVDDILPLLRSVPVNLRRDEKELPDAVRMLIASAPDGVSAIPVSEHVPDLTHPEDIDIVSRDIDSN